MVWGSGGYSDIPFSAIPSSVAPPSVGVFMDFGEDGKDYDGICAKHSSKVGASCIITVSMYVEFARHVLICN